MILVNGNVITMTAADATVAEHRGQALAIHDARILAVGDESAVRAAVSVGAQVVDLEGKTVLPGFIDSHMHCFVTGISLVSARLETAASVAEVCERMAEQAGRTPAGSWVYGTGCVPWALAEGATLRWRNSRARCPTIPPTSLP